MTAISGSYWHATLWDTDAPTSSRGSLVGNSLSAMQAGAIDPSGPEVVPANPSPSPGKAVVNLTRDTCGLRSSASSASVALQQSLANRLQERLDSHGSTMFALTWSLKATPLRRQICRLRASALRTSDSDFGGWPTPMAGSPATETYNAAGNNDSSRRTVALVAGWPTPKQSDSDKGVRTMRGAQKELERKGSGSDLPTLAASAWATPQASDGHGSGINQHTHSLDKQVRGQISSGSLAQTEKPGQLNPAFSRWLMGFPPEWDACAGTVTPSSRKSPPSSCEQ